jgi:hypothetical protein
MFILIDVLGKMVYWDATAEIDLWVTDGLEIFVIEGSF